MTRSVCEKYVRFHKHNIEWNRSILCIQQIATSVYDAFVIYDTCIKSTFTYLKLLKKVPNLQHNQHFYLDIWSLSETFIRRSLFNSSSGSCHDSDATWQEIGRMCGSACSSPRPGLLMKVSDRNRNVKVKMLVVLK